jgi:SAM-dependent methyltransferase/MFS family permease
MLNAPNSGRRGALSGVTIFASAFLLFALEPLVAKRILPWFGGSAAVWSMCLVFFQTALLVGYLYALLVTRYLNRRTQALLHIALLAASLALLPIGPTERWKPGPSVDPSWQILAMLTATIGLPFVVLSATSPLLQAWLARDGHKMPYRFFAISNFASLAALLAYPLLVEPHWDAPLQSRSWSLVYVLFAVLCALVAWLSRRTNRSVQAAREVDEPRVTTLQKAYWFGLSACGSMLLLSVTNHIDENVAPVPLLWVLPLALYLLSFVLGFGSQRFYVRSLWLRLLAFALGILGYAIYNINAMEAIQVSLPIFLIGLFVCCTFCQGELYRLRPGASGLTGFYLMIAFGGAAGAIFVGIIAPHIFAGIYELPVALCITAGMALLLTWNSGQWAARLLWAGVLGCMISACAANVRGYRENALSLRRSFYGSLRVVQSPRAGPEQTRTLFHGTIQHGAEYLARDRQRLPIKYYGAETGIGIALREFFPGPKRVGIIGLGTGTIAAYGKPGDTFRFYEINRQVIDMAESLFFYTRESTARVEIVEGDARLSLEQDTTPPFDVLALDAFSGDAIPMHLLTREAMALYVRHLKPDGVMVFHVSNNYLNLAPVVAQLANEIGYRAVDVKTHENPEELLLPTEWMLVSKNPAVFENETVKVHAQPIASRAGLRPWTDSFNNLAQIVQWPQLH